MRHAAWALVALASVATVAAQLPPAPPAGIVRLRVDTELGAIELEVDTVRAPATAANFLKYVDGEFFTGGQIHRSARLETQADRPVRIEVIQASINRARSGDGFAPVPLERTSVTGLLHKDGTVSMARGGPDSATSSFFVCIGDQPSLDFGGARNPDGQGFAAFGRVVTGMDVVRKTHQARAKGETLTPPIRIVSITRVGQAR